MATTKRGPHKPRKPSAPIVWTPEMDARIRRLSASGMKAPAISQATGIPPRSITGRLAVLRGGGASTFTRPRSEDPYGLRTPAARKAEAAVEAGLLEAARDDTVEWRAWELVHVTKLPAKEAARKLGIPLTELWDSLVRQKSKLAARNAG